MLIDKSNEVLFIVHEIASRYFIIGCCSAILCKHYKTFDIANLTSQRYIELKFYYYKSLSSNLFYLFIKNIFDCNTIIDMNAFN